LISAVPEVHQTGTSPGLGTFSCVDCGSQLSLETLDELPDCPECGSSRYRRASIFEHPHEQPEHTLEFTVPGRPAERPDWLADARESLSEPGRYLVCEEDGLEVFRLSQGWNRIGRSATADVRLDDPTVSRRHALLVWETGEPLRVLDDRSLNGIQLNGDLTEWGTMRDGDELAIGRYRLFLLEV
jgi:hypothetical protein